MEKTSYDLIVIGGGFFGCSIAIHFAKQGQKVIVLEREKDVLQRASYNNQARVHNGYHYPRSVLTAMRSRINFPLFVEEYADCIANDFDKYYAVSSHLSKVTSQQYYAFCKHIGADIVTAPDSIKQLFDPNYIEDVFTVKEYAFDAVKLKERTLRSMEASKVKLELGASVRKVAERKTGKLTVTYDSASSKEVTIEATQVFNCAYSQINAINKNSGLPILPLKHELTEMCLVEVPEPLQKMGVTVMCGPFFSCMPFPARGLHTLSHVRYTPHQSWQDDKPASQGSRGLSVVPSSAFGAMLRDASRYMPMLAESAYRDSLWEIKTVLASTETDDSRPILFKRDHGLRGYTCVMGGKIDNIYDILQEITAAYGQA